MRAIVSEVAGGPATLVLRDVPTPESYPGGVLIDVRAAAVNFPDLLMIEDKYQLKPPRPFTPGGEVAGVVRSIGEGVTAFKVGDRVLANVAIGGFAQQAIAPAERCYPVPDAMPFDVAACLLYTYGTTYHALVDRGAFQRGERMLVLGAAGGVGVAAIQLGVALGGEIVAAARGVEKLDFCRAQGASHVIDYARDDLRASLRKLGGLDVVYDAVGGDFSEPALRALRPGGRFLVIGFAAGTIPRLALNLVLLKECSVVGVQWGAWAMREPMLQAKEVAALVKLWESGSIAPQVGLRVPLDHTAEALKAVADRTVLGKAIVIP